jgi:hypothetical protein
MQYRHITGEFDRKFPHCIWIDNSQPGINRSTGANRLNPLGQAELDGIVRVTYRGDLVLADHLQQWLDERAIHPYQLSGHARTGMAILFSNKSDAMHFKLQWSR